MRSTPAVQRRIPTDEDRASFGAFLAAARLSGGRSLEDISSTTKVTKRLLEALEQGRVEILPDGLYRRAILRDYATAVGLDPIVALERFHQTFDAQAAPEPRNAAAAAPMRTLDRRHGDRRPGAVISRWLSTSIAVPTGYLMAVVAAAAMIYLGQSVLRVDRVATPVSTTAPAHSTIPATPASSGSTIDPSIGTGGHAPVEHVSAQVRTEAAGDLDDLQVADEGEMRSMAEPQLVVTSNPEGARVTVDGIAWGFTPVTIRYLSPGAKTVRVTKDGYMSHERRVNVRAAGESRVRLTLRPRGPEPGSPNQSFE